MIDNDTPVSLEALAMRPDVKSAEFTLRASFQNTRVLVLSSIPHFI